MTFSAGLTQGLSVASFPSYFLGTSASAVNPRSILAGDRRLLLYSAGMDERTTNHYNRVVQIKRSDVFGVKNTNINWMPEWHQGRANLLLQDGSVTQCNPGPLRRTLREAFLPGTAGFDLFLPAL
ncbi:MAG TPA: hypothetical protein VMF06_05170 [Candidatus Limnocylindria bacterium]|nr:hypothetical protein [Candidatus Limnocylindria bacterium]